MPRVFTWCDAHPALGGPHLSKALIVGPYFTHDATLVMCTHRNRKGKVCGSEYLVPGRAGFKMCVWCGAYGEFIPERKVGGIMATLHDECYAEVRLYRQGTTQGEMLRKEQEGGQ